VRTPRAAFADGSLTMITCGCGLERAEGLRLTAEGGALIGSRDVGRWGALGSARGQPGAARCGHNCGQVGYWASISTSIPSTSCSALPRHWLAASERTLHTAERHRPRHEPSTLAMACADSAQCLSVIVTHRQRLTAWRRHDLGVGVRAIPSLETAPDEWPELSTAAAAG
jgi:hypothetical protein